MMDDSRIDHAFDRIEKALARIETRAALARRDAADNASLAARHDALRSSVAASLRDLDGLIRKLEQ